MTERFDNDDLEKGNLLDIAEQLRDFPGVRSITIIPGNSLADVDMEGLSPLTRRMLIRARNTVLKR